MQTFTAITECRICGSSELRPILSLGNQCLTGVFPRSPDEHVTRGPLELLRCEGSGSCGLVQLAHTYQADEMYGPTYGYRSGLNASMVDHLGSKVRGLVGKAGLRTGDVVLDIGSNDGTTLSFYPAGVCKVGIDPTAGKFSRYYPAESEIVADFFSAARFDTACGGRKAKVVTSIAMLYDLADPLDFARQVESILADDGIWHFEQSYLPSMLSVTGYDTICHEHVEYYALAQIDWIMQRAGLDVIDVELNDVNGGSFAVTVCKAGTRSFNRSERVSRIRSHERSLALDSLLPFQQFTENVERHRTDLNNTLNSLAADGRLVLGYGASTKGNVILQYCGIGRDTLPCFAEVNPDKFGAFTPGSVIPIVSESDAHAMRPDYLLVMPWHFRQNLVQRETQYLRTGGRMIFPLPSVQIVSAP